MKAKRKRVCKSIKLRKSLTSPRDKSQRYHTVTGEQVAVGRRWESVRVNGIGWGAERKGCGRAENGKGEVSSRGPFSVSLCYI